MKRAAAWSLGTLLLVGFGTAQAVTAADRYRFEPRASAGDVFETTSQFILKMQLPASAETKEGDSSFTMTTVGKTRREVLATRDGKATDLRVTYLMHSMELTGGEKKVAMNLPDAGRTFLIRKRKGKLEIKAKDGKVDASTRETLANILELAGPVRFPNVDLAMGDEWDVPGKEVTGSGEIEQMRARLVGFEGQGEENQARFQISKSQILGTPTIPGASNASYTIRLEGEFRYSPSRQRPVTMNLKGPAEFSATTMKEGKEVPFSGTGEAQESYSEKWIKVAGKPVAEPTPVSLAQ